MLIPICILNRQFSWSFVNKTKDLCKSLQLCLEIILSRFVKINIYETILSLFSKVEEELSVFNLLFWRSNTKYQSIIKSNSADLDRITKQKHNKSKTKTKQNTFVVCPEVCRKWFFFSFLMMIERAIIWRWNQIAIYFSILNKRVLLEWKMVFELPTFWANGLSLGNINWNPNLSNCEEKGTQKYLMALKIKRMEGKEMLFKTSEQFNSLSEMPFDIRDYKRSNFSVIVGFYLWIGKTKA